MIIAVLSVIRDPFCIFIWLVPVAWYCHRAGNSQTKAPQGLRNSDRSEGMYICIK
jgi:hypothetical protein